MTERNRLFASIVTIITDYRAGELPAPTVEHVDRWVSQFSEDVQEPILSELEYVFSRTYFNKQKVTNFLRSLVVNQKLTQGNPREFWRNVKVLDIQQAGNSQREMLTIFEQELEAACDLKLSDCGETPTMFLYLDDVLFTGSRIKTDLTSWIANSAPAVTKVAVVTIGYHRYGQWRTKEDLAKVASQAGKIISFEWWRCIEIEDRKKHTDVSDVLRPTIIPDDPTTKEYVKGLGFEPVLRQAGSVGRKGFFSSNAGRDLLEQEFLKKGAYIRSICPKLKIYHRPLGNTLLKTTGFGSMIVTFRNCPNNAPLALWAGHPWYPLFARKTN